MRSLACMTPLKRLKQPNRNSIKGEQLTSPKMEMVNAMTKDIFSSLVFSDCQIVFFCQTDEFLKLA